MADRLAIVGGDAAGMSAATNARRRDPDLEIVAFERGAHTSYSACGIPYYVADLVHDVDDLVVRSPERHRESGIDVRTGAEVVGLDLDARELTVRADGAERTEPFDRLVLATGARAVELPIPGIEATEPARTLDAARRFREQVERRGESAVVVGAGYIGIEMAEALVHRGLRVALVEQVDHVFPVLDGDMAEHVREAAEGVGIEIHTGTSVEEVLVGDDGAPRGVRTSDGELPARHVVMATGVAPDVDPARAAGLPVGETGALAVDDHQRAGDGVWAAGDCVESHHRLLDRPVNVQLGTHANKQGRIAGVNATGGDLAFPGVIGTAISRICKREVALTGLTEDDAADGGFDVVAAKVEAQSRAGYYPEAGRVWVKVVAERGSGRLLGAQVVGAETAGKRIDTVAMAVWTRMAVDELQWVDLGYAPPVSPVLDPVLVAARVVAARL